MNSDVKEISENFNLCQGNLSLKSVLNDTALADFDQLDSVE